LDYDGRNSDAIPIVIVFILIAPTGIPTLAPICAKVSPHAALGTSTGTLLPSRVPTSLPAHRHEGDVTIGVTHLLERSAVVVFFIVIVVIVSVLKAILKCIAVATAVLSDYDRRVVWVVVGGVIAVINVVVFVFA
jgi:hypothetical protein